MNFPKFTLLPLSLVIGLFLSIVVTHPPSFNSVSSIFNLADISAVGIPGSTGPVITKFSTIYQTPSGLPAVTWTVTGPSGTQCDVLEGSNNATRFFLPNQSSGSIRVLTNSTLSRTVRLQCVGNNKSAVAYSTIPRDIDIANSSNGTSIKPLSIASFNVTPANRPVGVSGTLSWSVDCGPAAESLAQCSCALSNGTTNNEVVSRSGTKTISNTTSTAKTYRLTCVTVDGAKRQSQLLTDSVGTNPPPPPPSTTDITSFSVLPSPRTYNQLATLSWVTTNATKCRLSGGAMVSVNVAVQSSLESGSASPKFIAPSSVAPNATTTTPFSLQCDNGKTGTEFKIDTATVNLVTNPKAVGGGGDGGPVIDPPPDSGPGGSYNSGAHIILPGSDEYANYNITSPKEGENQLRVRIAQKIPVFSNGRTVAKISEPSLWALFFAKITQAAEPTTIDIFRDGVAHYDQREVLKVPYWTKIKFQWRWAKRTQMDATKDPQRPTNLPGGDWCGYVKEVQTQCKKQFPNDSSAYDACLHSKIAWPAQAVAYDIYNSVTKTYADYQELYKANFMSCQDQFGSGEWEWKPTPNDPIKTVQITSQIWGPNGNTPFNYMPTFLPQMSSNGTQRFVAVSGYKCEKPFDDIITSLNNSNPIDITEDSLLDWSIPDDFDRFYYEDPAICKYFKADPTKCNSGDMNDIKQVMIGYQCQQVVLAPGGQMNNVMTRIKFDSLASLNQHKNPFSMGFFIYNKDNRPVWGVSDFYDWHYGKGSGAHAVIGLDVKMTPHSVGGATYDVKILDSNDSSEAYTIKCRGLKVNNSLNDDLIVCDSPGYFDESGDGGPLHEEVLLLDTTPAGGLMLAL